MITFDRVFVFGLLLLASTSALAQRPGGRVQFLVAAGAGLFGFLLGVLFGLWLCKRRHKHDLLANKPVSGGPPSEK